MLMFIPQSLLYFRLVIGTTSSYLVVYCSTVALAAYLLRGTIVNRTYGTHKKLYIHLLLLTICGPIYYGPP